MEECVAACGTLTDAAGRRAEAALALRRPPDPADTAALDVELAELSDG